MTGRVIVGLLWLMLVLIVAGAWSAGAAKAAAEQRSKPAPAVQLQTSPGPAEPVSGQRVAPTALSNAVVGTKRDLYGNEVEAAVSDYRIDFTGEVYERHAPQTELARLGAPSL